MNREQLKQLEDRLWKAADDLRANSKLTATEYSFPVLGLIFLRHAYNRFITAKAQIEESLPSHPQRGKRPVNKTDFLSANAIFLPENAQWKTINELPESADVGEYLNEAMKSIEAEYEVLQDVLPKDYVLFESDLLFRLIRIFNDPLLDNVTGDVFGRIYEYFLNKFAMSGAQEGGEFFTPPSLVNAIVNIIEPNHGTVFDPACGSAGMFVQTAHFIEENLHTEASQKVTFYGQEKADTNTKLAKMNMAVHGLDAKIMQGNTFYDDHHDLVGKCDFVMANPPFNVDGVDKKKESVKNDPRLPLGLPKNDNANYLWIQYFYSYLNETGRAGFVMASSASDAGHSEKKIRQQLVETGAVDVMVSIGTKFFYTRSLPCSLWFFDRSKEQDAERADKILMLDLRDVFRKVSSNLHDFTDEQLQNIQALVRLYRGDRGTFNKTLDLYREKSATAFKKAQEGVEHLNNLLGNTSPEVLNLAAEPESNYQNSKRSSTVKEWKVKYTKAVKKQVDSNKNEAKADPSKRGELKRKTGLLEKVLATFTKAVERHLYFDKEIEWLKSRFPDGNYADVAGLCKVVNRKEIKANDYSLTAGRYVGVATVEEDEGFDFEERMAEIKQELKLLNEEAIVLAETIQTDLTELGI
ncbi:type I restriction-modification system subunit M [Leeuwenhoekiella parthenopeia]|uniref:site-specific DNA-methyltransferase (adenine-specific) n=1 Tax=Leeuwenhoekiella parthenopeia TaxID=2890320 RepID=A0ABS8GMX3_9FLAO|nr:class I SAM-dependent DNA methyltransferase [Leeuwenhoekiella parthenopeia]MCC4211334.1 type I restriction-modification system subunit M [Leeuwenhoekiella parthenopeia]